MKNLMKYLQPPNEPFTDAEFLAWFDARPHPIYFHAAYNLNRVASWRKNTPSAPLCAVSVRPGNRREHTLGHVHSMAMMDVSFVVSAAGIRKVRTTGRRAVCAWAKGVPVAYSGFESFKDRKFEPAPVQFGNPAPVDHLGGWNSLHPFTFNPHRDDSFILSTSGRPIKGADVVIFRGSEARLFGPRFVGGV